MKAAELKAILESFKQGKALENLASDLKVMLNKYPGDARILRESFCSRDMASSRLRFDCGTQSISEIVRRRWATSITPSDHSQRLSRPP